MIEQDVAKHYCGRSTDLEEKILQALQKSGKDLNNLVWTDLGGLDEFHLRKREATVEMAELLNLQPETRILDAGSGLGGPSRYLASEFGCHITGIDLSGTFCNVARSFARRFGLDDRLSYQQGSVLELPFQDDSFDVVWTQHVSMNIGNKTGFFTELARVLKPDGMLACYDIIAGTGVPIDFPVPWAETEKISFLASAEEQKQAITYSGLKILSWDDKSQEALAWLEIAQEKLREEKELPQSHKVFRGEGFSEVMSNLVRNFQSGRTRVVQIIGRKPVS
ncbi:class I SAM-dependent methyltransferase [Endozoicomonas lisbonensis]|uniref:Ubiquinone/menaquinone biosynthesis C-methylase UbiE n=1 Tax=Endozoicomonas lisbonensis TaxID=3120522 RepID=A0ABV2SHB0_9GAMM